MPHPPRDGDLDINELVRRAAPVMLSGAEVYIKWTCPSCGERVMLDKPLEFNQNGAIVVPSGLLHTEKDDGSPCMISVPIREAKMGFTVLARIF